MSKHVFGWSYPPGVTGTEPEIAGYDCQDCCDTGRIGDDDCDVCGEGEVSFSAWVSPVQRIINICASISFSACTCSSPRTALDEIHAIAKAIQGTNEGV